MELLKNQTSVGRNDDGNVGFYDTNEICKIEEADSIKGSYDYEITLALSEKFSIEMGLYSVAIIDIPYKELMEKTKLI